MRPCIAFEHTRRPQTHNVHSEALGIHTLRRMAGEAHVLDAGHKLLETHAAAAVPLMLDFITRTQRENESTGGRQ